MNKINFEAYARLKNKLAEIKNAPFIEDRSKAIADLKKEMLQLLVSDGLYTNWSCVWPEAEIGSFGQLCPCCNAYDYFHQENGVLFPERFGNRLIMKKGPYGRFWGCECFPKCCGLFL